MVQLSVIVLGLLAAAWCFSGAAEGKRVEACRDDAVNLYCRNGKKIRLTYVSFKLGGKKCIKGKPQPGYNYNNPCHPRTALSNTVVKHCQGKRSCNFRVNTSVFKYSWLSCRGLTNVYVEVYFVCVWQV
ncbi:uncharacterized protein AB9X84_024431 [Acanthopagrus schlegelii]